MSLIVATGCGGGPLIPNAVEALSRVGGCADVIFYAVDVNNFSC